MSDGAYSAGTVFLQVVPVFDDVQNQIRKHVKDIDKSLVPDEKSARDAGKKTGDAIGDEIGKGIKDGAKRGTKDADDELGGFARRFQQTMRNASKSLGENMKGDLADIQKDLDRLGSKKVGVDLDAKAALAELEILRKRFAALDGERLEIDARVNALAAMASLTALSKAVSNLDGEKINIKADVDTARAQSKLAALFGTVRKGGGDGRDAANSFRALNGVLFAAVTIGPALIPILIGIAGGLVAIGVAAAGVVAGIAVMVVAFSGIGAAVSALANRQKNAAKDAEAYASAVKNAAQTVADAERQLHRARIDAAQAEADAARRVADAKREASRSIQEARQAEQQANEDLQRSITSVADAEQALRDARDKARQEQKDLRDQKAQNALDERQAQIDLFNAKVNFDATQADGGATSLDREQASIQLAQAKLNLKNIRDERDAMNKKNKDGVAGNDAVQSAQDALTAALDAQKQAEQDVRDAAQRTNRAQVDGARNVREALRQQHRQEQDNARSLSDAQRNLTRAQEDYQKALSDTGELGSSSMRTLQDAMGKLSPAGRRFARFIFGLRDSFYALRTVVQNGVLPGVQSGMEAIINKYGPAFVKFVRRMSNNVGNFFERLGKRVAKDKAFQNFFGMLSDLGPRFFRQFGTMSIRWLRVFARLMTYAAPFAVAFSNALVKLAGHADKWTKSSKGTKTWQDFLAYVAKVGPDVWSFLKDLFGATIAVVKAIAPLGIAVMGILDNVLKWIKGMDPKTLQIIVESIIALVVAFQLANAVVALTAGIFSVLLSPIGLIVVAVALLAAGIIMLYTHSEKAHKIIDKVFHAIGETIKFLWKYVVKPYFTFMFEYWKHVFLGMKWAWDHILSPVFGYIGDQVETMWKTRIKPTLILIKNLWNGLMTAMRWVWEHVLSPVFDAIASALGIGDRSSGLIGAFHTAVDAIGKVWDKLKNMLKVPVKFVVNTVLNGALIGGFNWIMRKVHLSGLQIPEIPLPKGFARGGIPSASDMSVYPGYTPGRDVGYIGISGGEGIIRPEATRVLGKGWIDEINARARVGGSSAVKGFLGGFKRGGIVWPTIGRQISTYRGHDGVDINAAGRDDYGDPIWAAKGGRVSYVGWGRGYGDAVFIRSADGLEEIYGHMSSTLTTPGAHVNSGELIGRIGSTGNSTGPHLHFGVSPGLTYAAALDFLLGGEVAATGTATKGGIWDHVKGVASLAKNLGQEAVAAIKDPKGYLKGKFDDAMGGADFVGPMLNIVSKMGSSLIGGLVDRVKDVAAPFIDYFGSSGPYDGVATSGNIVADLQGAASKKGWGKGEEWNALYSLVASESSFSNTAQNPNSTAYGLFQFLDSTWAGYGKKTDDPGLQIKYGLEYIGDRYGDPVKAWDFHQANGYYANGGVVPEDGGRTMMYDNGGYLPPGLTTVLNLTGKPEPVFTNDQWDNIRHGDSSGTAGHSFENHFHGTGVSAGDVADEIMFELRHAERGGVYGGPR